jgi:parvulin-like peptidyl-prolyl isomerase
MTIMHKTRYNEAMRERINRLIALRIVYRALISLLAIVFVFSCDSMNVVATVDSEKIALKEFEEVSMRKARLLGVESLNQAQKQDVLDALIQREIVYLDSVEKGLKVTDKEIKEESKDLSLFDRLRYKKVIQKNIMLEKAKQRFVGSGKVSEKELKKYYESHKAEFTMPVLYKVYLVKVEKKDLEHVSSKLVGNPDAFDDMALNRVSPDLRELNKNATFTQKDYFPEEMWPYLQKMNIGDIEGPIDVKRGMFIFKLVDKKPESVQSFEEVYIEMEHFLTAQKKKESFERWYEGIKGNYDISIIIDISSDQKNTANTKG